MTITDETRRADAADVALFEADEVTPRTNTPSPGDMAIGERRTLRRAGSIPSMKKPASGRR